MQALPRKPYTPFRFAPKEELKYAKQFTQTYKAALALSPAERELSCLRVQHPQLNRPPLPGDALVGRMSFPVIMFSPQGGHRSLGYCLDDARVEILREALAGQDALELEALVAYWQTECTREKIRAAYPPEIREALPFENYTKERAVAHVLYRLSGAQQDFGKLLRIGVCGLKTEIDSCKSSKPQAENLYSSMQGTLDVYTSIVDWYAGWIEGHLATITDAAWAGELHKTLHSLQNIRTGPAQSLRDAVQMVLIWWYFSGALNLARMDTYLAEYYVQDVDSGVITEEEALHLLCELWRMLVIRNRPYDTRIVIGGKGRENEEACNRFCLLAIKASQRVRDVTPQLSLRFYKGMDERVMEQAYKSIGDGCTFPMLYNDDANIPAVQKAFNVPYEEAKQYCPYGCGEYIVNHRSIGTPSGIINLTKALEAALNHGRDLETDARIAPDFGGLEEYGSFEELFTAYKRQIEYLVPKLARQERLEYDGAGRQAAFLCYSILFDDCIMRGKPLLGGGIRYLGGTLESYGNVNAANSLTAIQQVLYEQAQTTPEELLQALRVNFAGHGILQRRLVAAPKYGNDDPQADAMLGRVHSHICLAAKNSAAKAGLHSYLVVVINNDANTVLGHLTAASADGRPSGAPLANANNPYNGTDTAGLTAMLNSLLVPAIDIHAGSVQNLKLSKQMFTPEVLPVTRAILGSWFARGGSQLMVTVVSRRELEDAVLNPQAHQSLIVRVGGFSARFIELGADVQQELLSRTLY